MYLLHNPSHSWSHRACCLSCPTPADRSSGQKYFYCAETPLTCSDPRKCLALARNQGWSTQTRSTPSLIVWKYRTSSPSIVAVTLHYVLFGDQSGPGWLLLKNSLSAGNCWERYHLVSQASECWSYLQSVSSVAFWLSRSKFGGNTSGGLQTYLGAMLTTEWPLRASSIGNPPTTSPEW